MINAMYIHESGLLTPVTLIRDGQYYITDSNGPRYRVDPTTTSQLLGWGKMNGEVVGLVDADAEFFGDTPRAEFWIKSTRALRKARITEREK